jgi:hypothetical protein
VDFGDLDAGVSKEKGIEGAEATIKNEYRAVEGEGTYIKNMNCSVFLA